LKILLSSLLFLIFSCAQLREISKANKKQASHLIKKNIKKKIQKTSKTNKSFKSTYAFQDTTGSYFYDRELTLRKKRVFFEGDIKNNQNSKSIEKTKIITDIKINKSGRILNKKMEPVISQYSTWFDGKEYRSQIEIKENGQVELILAEKFEDHTEKSQYSYDSNNKNCFFSMIPECLKFWNVFDKLKNNQDKMSFNIIWENYPFNKKIYSNGPRKLISNAYVVFESVQNDRYIYSVVVDEKNMSYQFDRLKRFIAFFWVSEGLSLSKKKL
jgi:hypothetical protein